MAANTKIQWATHTFNPWRGCVKIAAGCANCYAETQSKRNPATLGVWGPHGTRVVASEAMWRQPLGWNKVQQCYPQVPTSRVFCASLADVFEDWGGFVCNSRGEPLHNAAKWLRGKSGSGGSEWLGVPGQLVGQSLVKLDDVRARLAGVWDATPNLTWLVLTKRIENARRMWPGVTVERDESFDPPKDRAFAKRRDNVWLGVSIACQDDADRLIPELLKCRDLCAKTFLSIEPMLDDVDIRKWLTWELDVDESQPPGHFTRRTTGIDWVIVGGESGPNARPCHVDWLRSIVRQCKAAGVPPFVKQAGAVPYVDDVCRDKWALSHDRRQLGPGLGYRILIRDKKGGDLSELPEDLRVREVPS